MNYIVRDHLVKEGRCDVCEERENLNLLRMIPVKCMCGCCDLRIWVCRECTMCDVNNCDWKCRIDLDEVVFWRGDNQPRVRSAYDKHTGLPVRI